LKRVLLTAAAALFTASSAAAYEEDGPARFVANVRQAIERGDTSITLSAAAPSRWAFVCFFDGYTDNAKYGLKLAETEWAFVFFENERRYKIVRGDYGSFHVRVPLSQRGYPCFGRDTAARLVTRARDGSAIRRLDLTRAKVLRSAP
jgi:hypothetical protein